MFPGLLRLKRGKRIKEGKDAVQLRVCGSYRCVVDQAKRRAFGAVSLTEAVILQVEPAVIVERCAPEHGAMVHHAVIDVADDFVVTKAAGLFGDAQVAGVNEPDELGRFVIEPDVRVRRIRRRFPELLVGWENVRLFFR